MARPALADLYVGQTLAGQFRVLDYLGQGQFSLVFSALDLSNGEEVAIKVLLPTSKASDRLEFDTECELLDLSHSASSVIDRITDGEDKVMVQIPNTGALVPLPVRYLVLERAERSLADLLAVRDQLSWEDRLAIFRSICKGVHQLHLQQIVHRDLKSDNVLIVLSGKVVTAKVSDLGRARLLSRPARFAPTDYERGRGDLRFAPPEFLFHLGHDDPSSWYLSDVYFLGSILFELATGQGLTTASLGDVRPLLHSTARLSIAERRREFAASQADIRARYESSYVQFGAQLPPSIRHEADRVLRQITNSTPQARLPQRKGRAVLDARDLQWLLRRVDILRLQLITAAKPTRKRRAI